MINFGKMEVEGFASIHKETFDWSLPGLNIIQAGNGFGKTTFINALFWCIYGKTLSGSVEPWEHMRSPKYRGTRVSIEFEVKDIKWKITRHKDFTKIRSAL